MLTDKHCKNGHTADQQPAPIPVQRRNQHLKPVHAGWRTGKFWQLTANDDQTDSTQITTDYRVRYVFNQPAYAEKSDENLDQAGEYAQDGHQQDYGQRL